MSIIAVLSTRCGVRCLCSGCTPHRSGSPLRNSTSAARMRSISRTEAIDSSTNPTPPTQQARVKTKTLQCANKRCMCCQVPRESVRAVNRISRKPLQCLWRKRADGCLIETNAICTSGIFFNSMEPLAESFTNNLAVATGGGFPTVLAFAGLGFAAYYILVAVKPPELIVRPGSAFQRFLLRHVPLLRERYWPFLYCLEGKSQMILSTILRSQVPEVPYQREIFTFSDGGKAALHWLPAKHTPYYCSTNPLVVFVPGITGEAQSDYLRTLVTAVTRAGATAIVANYRGRAGVPLKHPWALCATNTKDLAEIINHLRIRHPSAPLFTVGISLGAILLGQYLASEGSQASKQIRAAMLISTGFHVPSGMMSMDTPCFNKLLNRYLVMELCELVKSQRQLFENGGTRWNVDKILKSRSAREFDDSLTCPMFGYSDADEYYEAASVSGDLLKKIKVPVLALSAADDPFQPKETLPIESVLRSSHVALAVTARGGHVAFLEGWKPQGNSHFAERLLAQFLSAAMHYPEEMTGAKTETQHAPILTSVAPATASLVAASDAFAATAEDSPSPVPNPTQRG